MIRFVLMGQEQGRYQEERTPGKRMGAFWGLPGLAVTVLGAAVGIAVGTRQHP